MAFAPKQDMVESEPRNFMQPRLLLSNWTKVNRHYLKRNCMQRDDNPSHKTTSFQYPST